MTRLAIAAAALGALVTLAAWCLARIADEADHALTVELVLREAERILAVPTEGL